MQTHISGAIHPRMPSPAIMPGHFLSQVGHLTHFERNAAAVVGLVLLDALNTGRLVIHDEALENAAYAFQDALHSTVESGAVTSAALAVCACAERGAA